jgi:hypothetical protein
MSVRFIEGPVAWREPDRHTSGHRALGKSVPDRAKMSVYEQSQHGKF